MKIISHEQAVLILHQIYIVLVSTVHYINCAANSVCVGQHKRPSLCSALFLHARVSPCKEQEETFKRTATRKANVSV